MSTEAERVELLTKLRADTQKILNNHITKWKKELPVEVVFAMIYATMDDEWKDLSNYSEDFREDGLATLLRQMYYHGMRGNEDSARLISGRIEEKFGSG